MITSIGKQKCPWGEKYDPVQRRCVDVVIGVDRITTTAPHPTYQRTSSSGLVLSDNVRPEWAGLNDAMPSGGVIDFLKKVRGEASKTVSSVTGDASNALSGAVRDGIRDGVQASIEQHPATAKSIVGTGVVIGLGAAAALVTLGIVIGRKK